MPSENIKIKYNYLIEYYARILKRKEEEWRAFPLFSLSNNKQFSQCKWRGLTKMLASCILKFAILYDI